MPSSYDTILTDGLHPGGGGGGGGGGGAAGTLVYDSGAAGLTFGTGSPPADKTIQFTSQQDGEAYVCRVVHSGPDAAFYEIISYTRGSESVTLATPHNCDTDGDFVVGLDEPSPSAPATITITYRTLYADETEQSMTVDVYDAGSGTLLDSITATATFEDPFQGALAAEATLKEAYAPGTIAIGAVTSGNPVMEGTVNALASANGIGSNHSVVATSGLGPLESLSKAWRSTAQGNSDYMASGSDPGGSKTEGGLIIFKFASASFLGASVANKLEMMATIGTSGSPAPGVAAQVQVNGTHYEEGQGTTTVTDTFGAGVAHDQDSEWYAAAFINNGSTLSVWLTKLTTGFAWKDVGEFTAHTDGYWNPASSRVGTTIRMMYAISGTVSETVDVAHASQYTNGVTEAKLQAIVESIIL